MDNKSAKSKNELYCYIASIVLMVAGLALIIIGIVGSYLPVTNDLYIIQSQYSLRYIGLAIFVAGAVFMIITLIISAKKVDRVTDRELRRKQRLSAMMSDANDKEEIFVTDGKIVSSDKNNEAK